MTAYVSLLTVRNSYGIPRGWKAATRHGSVVVYRPLRSTDLDDARSEAAAMFPGTPVWAPSTGEAMP